MSDPLPPISRRTALAVIATGVAARTGLAHAADRRVPRQVLAFYYGWYANPTVTGRWAHWPGPTGKEAPNEKPNFDQPLLGMYDSHDPQVLAQHAKWAKQAGLTGIISGGWTRNSHEDRSTALLLDAMNAEGLKVSVYLEGQKAGVDGAEADLRYLCSTYGGHPAWLKVDGRPVIFFYNRALVELPAAGWREAARRIAAAGQPEPLFIGDADPEGNDYAERLQSMDGTHVYVLSPYLKGMTPEEIRRYTDARYPSWKSKAGGKIRCATVMPGYNDTKNTKLAPPRPTVDRFGTATFDTLWRAAVKTDPDWILVTSFNAWNDGTEIEPSREWGETHLDASRSFARSFLGK